MIASKVRPTDEMIKDAWTQNDAGGGIAWRDGKEVRWKKGLMKPEEMHEICQTTPLPYVAHFRIPSAGGKTEKLCHPFPIEKKVSLDLEGRTKGNVLFHNGHWTRWKDMTLEACLRSNTPIPNGKWSDTRGMAYMASIYGTGILEFIDEKAVVFGPDECTIFMGTGWKLINDIWCSNDFFSRGGHIYNGNTGYMGNTGNGNVQMLCKHVRCASYRLRGSDYCYQHKHMESDNVDMEELPTIKTEDKSDDEKKVDLNNNSGINENDGNGGGDHKLLPFHVIDNLYKSEAVDKRGKRLISKNMWKKARKRMLKANRNFAKHQKKLAMEKFHQMRDVPIHVVTH